ncbi:hypothetical protein J2Z21_002822 [Streptomyces griseochromogenes]|uniref:Transposase IS701-like DDE domain-containing protein n=1 Tax=Streptomyces griseochromogenes TaxID=68214 RepID=A0ABS4LR51_9ACTN|nr:hypothetical protein [Streptomyces griseochromogenes]
MVLGLLSDLPRQNCWTIAEWAAEATPDRIRHLLCRAEWGADQVRDEVRGGNTTLRTALEERGIGYVLAVARTHEVATAARKFRANALTDGFKMRSTGD